MPDVPYPITAENSEDLKRQIWELIREIFEERIGGLNMGDVFVDSGGVLTLNLASSTPGLQKVSNALQVEIKPVGGLQATSTGIAAKLKSAGGLDVDSSGLYVSSSHYGFGTFDCPAGTDPVADIPNDTLTLIAGAGVSITGDSTADSVTIANTDGGAAAVSTHSALTTGVHGVGIGTVAEVADIAVDANLSVAAQAVVTAGACDVDANLSAAAQAAISASHARSHALDGTSDHTIGSLTSTYLVKSDGTKLAPATNTDAQVSAAVTASHAAASVLDTDTIDFGLTGQQITGSVKNYWTSAAALADTATVTLPTITANYPAHGFIHCAHASTGVISESAEFEFGSTGTVQIIRGSANIEANGATAGKISLGPAVAANPVVIKNNLGGGVSVNVMISLWYA